MKQFDVIKEKDIDYLQEGFFRLSPRQTSILVDIFVNDDNITRK